MIKGLVQINALVFSLLLVSCGGSGDGGGSGDCTIPSIAGEPDITGSPSFSTNAVTAGDSVTVTVPLDADVAFVTWVTLITFGSQSIDAYSSIGGAVVPAEQNWQYSIDTTGMPPGDYLLELDLCSDSNSCSGASTGVGVNYTTYYNAPSTQYLRYKYWDNGVVDEQMDTCIDIPHITIN